MSVEIRNGNNGSQKQSLICYLILDMELLILLSWSQEENKEYKKIIKEEKKDISRKEEKGKIKIGF